MKTFYDTVKNIHQRPSHIREGQWMMNKLHEIDKDLYNEVAGTECDPFYDDDKIPQFVQWLHKKSKNS